MRQPCWRPSPDPPPTPPRRRIPDSSSPLGSRTRPLPQQQRSPGRRASGDVPLSDGSPPEDGWGSRSRRCATPPPTPTDAVRATDAASVFGVPVLAASLAEPPPSFEGRRRELSPSTDAVTADPLWRTAQRARVGEQIETMCDCLPPPSNRRREGDGRCFGVPAPAASFAEPPPPFD